jgi:hypothetical protein
MHPDEIEILNNLVGFPFSPSHVLIFPPHHEVDKEIQMYLDKKIKNPQNLSACVVVPRRPNAPWLSLLQGMRKIKGYRMGSKILQVGNAEQIQGNPWAMDVYYDPPRPKVSIAAATQGSPLLMTFRGCINGAPGLLTMDTGASHCFIDPTFVKVCGIHTKKTHQQVELADGTSVQVQTVCEVNIKIASPHSRTLYKKTVTCLVLDLGAGFDVILGQDWLLQEQAILSYADKECTLKKSGVTLKPFEKESPTVKLAILTAAQAKKAMDNSAYFFMVNVVDAKGTVVGEQTNAPSRLEQIPSHVSPPVAALLHKYSHVFGKRAGLPPDRGIAHVIPEEPGSKSVFRNPYRLSPAETAEVGTQVAELLKLGLIEPSNSPYGAPILFVTKKDGTLRMCCDWRRLNSQTIKSRYPLPRIDQLLDQLHGAKYFSSLDLQSGYHQIRILPEDVPKTAFTTPTGHYQFKVMSFGLCNAPSTFQAVMNKVFQRLLYKGVLVYMDDILIYAKTAEEHAHLLEEVLKLLKQNDLYAKLSKCEFEQTELKYLGHIINCEGIKVNPEKTKVISEWPVPQSQKEVRSFLGLANYFRRFMDGYATIVAPLHNLTKVDVKWGPSIWTHKCQEAFDGVKWALSHAPVLAVPDPAKAQSLEVICDASILGVGAVLLQDERPLAYESKKLTPAEVQWTTTDQELWAVVHALKTWRCYLEGIHFTVVTDHNPLVSLQTQPNLSRRQARWSEYLQRFNFSWKYRPGRINVADPLSRVQLHLLWLKSVSTRSGKLPPPPPLPPPPLRHGVRIPPVVHTPAPCPALGDSQVVTAPADSPVVTSKAGTDDSPLAEGGVTFDNEALAAKLRAGYTLDPTFTDASQTKHWTFDKGLWWKEGKVVVPKGDAIRNSIFYELHDSCLSGHVGITKTTKAVQLRFWWPRLVKDVTSYIKNCVTCQRNKSSSLKPAGLLQPLPIPTQPWESISMDFITQLPATGQKFDALVVFVDRLTKMVHIAPTHTTVTAEGTANLFWERVFVHHGLPKTIVSDRGSVFTSGFMRELMRLLDTKQNLSTAWHPQSDGQTERMNRVIEDMFRHYVGALRHGEWDTCLVAVEFAINNSFQESVRNTPFYLNYGRHPRVPLGFLKDSCHNFSAAALAERWQAGLVEAKRCLQSAQQRQKAFYDAGHRDVSFQVGEEVLLSTRNLHLRRAGDKSSTPKLLPKWVGPFKILDAIGKGAYRLQLPDHMKIHPVFHVSLLKTFHSNGELQPPDPIIIDGEEEFELERILDHRFVKRGRKVIPEYLVKWRHFGTEHNTWEPDNSLSNTIAYEAYWKYVGLEPPVPPPV